MSKKSDNVMRYTALFCALYAVLRTLKASQVLASSVGVISPVCAVFVGYYTFHMCSQNWSKKGFFSLTVVLSFIVTDLICAVVYKLCLKSTVTVFTYLWIYGLFGLLGFGIIILYGYINEKFVVKRVFEVESDKVNREYKIAVLSDLHYGTIQRSDLLQEKVDEINGLKPDIVLLLGDLAEEGTSNSDMHLMWNNLGNIKASTGKYFIYGNHDRQEKSTKKGKKRTYTDDEYISCLEKGGYEILDDVSVNINDDLCIVGRKDYTIEDRLSADEVVKNVDANRFSIVAQHQIKDAKILNENKIDLSLSGHSHGGQNWPKVFLHLFDKKMYNGFYKVGDMKIYVTSGFAGGKYPIRTHEHSEYLIVEIKPKKK